MCKVFGELLQVGKFTKKSLKVREKIAIWIRVGVRLFNSLKFLVFIGFLNKCLLSLKSLQNVSEVAYEKGVGALNASSFHSDILLCLYSLSHTSTIVFTSRINFSLEQVCYSSGLSFQVKRKVDLNCSLTFLHFNKFREGCLKILSTTRITNTKH